MVDISALVPGSYIYEGSQTPLLNWRSALAKAAAGITKTSIVCTGDSTTVGTGSNGGSGTIAAGVKTLSWPTRLSARLNALGFNAGSESCFGDFGYGANAPVYDTRLVVGSWTLSTPANLAGNSFLASSATVTPLSFTPVGQTDTCEIYFFTNTSLGTFNWNVDGGANTPQSTSGSAGVSKVTINAGSVGAHTYNATWASGGQVFIIGFVAYKSANKEVSVINAGRGSAKAADFLSAFPTLAANIAAPSPSLWIAQVGINDWLNATSISSFQTSITSMIAAKPATADMIIMSPINSSPGNAAQSVQDQYTSAIRSLALASNIPYIDFNARAGGYSGANGAGMMYSDGIHGNAYYYGDEANLLANLLLNT